MEGGPALGPITSDTFKEWGCCFGTIINVENGGPALGLIPTFHSTASAYLI